jgi:hypothetical protein
MFRTTLRLAATAALLGYAGVASADDGPAYVIDGEAAAVDDKAKKDGIDWRVQAGATLNFSDNRSVIGQSDGSVITFGYKFGADVDWRLEAHEWRNRFAAAAALTRTPTVSDFVKAQDGVEVESIYLYHFVDWFGAFARVAWAAPMLRGSAVAGADTTFVVASLDGSVDTVVADRLPLSDPLKPSKFKESLGLFAQPLARPPITIELRAGPGARQVLASDQRAVDDDDATPEVEVTELDDVIQVGAEAVLEIWGSMAEKRVSYRVGAEVMTPLAHNSLPAGDDRGAFELTNVELRAELSFKLVDWASIDYQFKALREPQLIDVWQIQNQLLLTFGIVAGTASDDPPAE